MLLKEVFFLSSYDLYSALSAHGHTHAARQAKASLDFPVSAYY